MSDYTRWHVGMKVVCVDASPADDGGPSMLVENFIYTITQVWMCEGHVAVLIDSKRPRDGFEGWHAHRFRPVQPRSTDISMFTSMLVNPPKELAYEMPGRPFE